jgi:Fe-S-cluster-containing dehydrogenase component
MSQDKIQSAAPQGQEQTTNSGGCSRRGFVKGVGGFGLFAMLGTNLIRGFMLPDEVIAFPASEGYLLVDSKKCQGCNSCMMACSLTHHGVQSLSLSRIQVNQDPFAAWPNDKHIEQCRQCPGAPCVSVCPTGANHIDAKNGNVRRVDADKCIGCQRCVEACPFDQSRADWNFDDKHAQKCDLCAETPFWKSKGGANGSQACKAVCPVGAISFTKEVPIQDDRGYNVNLRDATWAQLDYPTE